jgi:hypothetical protein
MRKLIEALMVRRRWLALVRQRFHEGRISRWLHLKMYRLKYQRREKEQFSVLLKNVT